MNHYYEFFDRAVVDSLWGLQWKTLQKQAHARWFSRPVNHDGDGGESLRNVLALCIDPEPSDEHVDNMLRRLTVKKTLKQCEPQFWAMSEIMHHYFRRNDKCVFGVEVDDVGGLIAVAVQAFLDGRIRSRTLWAVLKLHSANPNEWLRLSAAQRRKFDAAVPWQQVWTPIYRWQGEDACKNDEWTNCLGVSDTRLFGKFVLRAHSENWRAAALTDSSLRDSPRFRDFSDCVVLATFMKSRVAEFRRPSVFRRWQ